METVARVRPLEAIPVEIEGEQMVLLRDPHRFVSGAMTVSIPVYLLMCLIDGARTPLQIHEEFRRRFGIEIAEARISELVSELDELGLLETERFEALRAEALADFERNPFRPAAHAGTAYEESAEPLVAQIDGFYESVDPDATVENAGENLVGLVAPHIDPRVGGPCAARAYRLLRGCDSPPDLFVILGTAHQYADNLFVMTEKTFETPLGAVEVDLEVSRALTNACPLDLKEDEYLHRFEHSIEFQAIFLQHLFAGHRTFKILPILVGSFAPYIAENTLPSEAEPVRLFTDALRQVLSQSGRRVCLVAGADLSHVGRKFGDEMDLSESLVDEIRLKDLEMLAHIQAGRREDFFRHLQRDQDRQKVCGLPPIYTLMSVLGDGCTAQLLDYDVSIEEPTQSFVTFASLGFYKDGAA
ncbi:AmmeMemoRadiSam system protein B [Candidatus Sumerlaeota bacterium]|nr:AmmeMemoRadiSam system protein B [Candidatus Sumerlaeota bacterium]